MTLHLVDMKPDSTGINKVCQESCCNWVSHNVKLDQEETKSFPTFLRSDSSQKLLFIVRFPKHRPVNYSRIRPTKNSRAD